MDSLKDAVNQFICNPQYAEVLALLKAARNGAVYGAKVRFPHALVMIFLFRNDTTRNKLRLIFKATRTHARNLATYALLYKTCMLLLQHKTPGSKPRESRSDPFVAGLIGGYAVFGRGSQSSVNQQIVIYVFARVVLALAKLAVQQPQERGYGMGRVMVMPEGWKKGVARNAWPVFAAVSWGAVMWLFRWHPETLQPSLRSSMKYIYTNADHWDGFRNFLLHNT
ncbi:MAG: peroxisomal membrane 4 [Lasallia pustulata]|uniref:Peroxisomal membrane 4 n=1 Tax=Lasallia pustulata TaxID=136370 RepID=A0A5M8PJQ7_9LECA|nr:MAG: peroxisomal membrane 4 [Lasallia pustulata]